MDADRFDALTRALDPGSRRRLFGVLTGVALGAVAPLRDLLDTEAKKRKKKKKKKPTCEGKACRCRTSGEFCAGICDEGPCGACCSGFCGFNTDIPDLICCVPIGKACPGNCKKNEKCTGCCGSGLCVSNGTCF